MRETPAIILKISLSILIFTSCGFEIKKSDTSNSPTVTPKKTTIRSKNQAILDFDNLMNWYHPETDYDKTQTAVMSTGENTFSVKFLHKWTSLEGNWGEKEGEKCQSCIGGYPCAGCGGDNRIDLLHYEKFRHATLKYDAYSDQVSLTTGNYINF